MIKDRKIVAQQTGLFPLKVHMGNYIDCIRDRKQPNGNIVEGHKSATLMHLANISHRAGKKQLYFSGDHEAIPTIPKPGIWQLGHTGKGLNYLKKFNLTKKNIMKYISNFQAE